jgi:hypothetical protein
MLHGLPRQRAGAVGDIRHGGLTMKYLPLLAAMTFVTTGFTQADLALAQNADDEVCALRVRAVCGENVAVGKCFADNSKWADVGAECEGAVQTLIENENEANQAEGKLPSAVGYAGFSYGGQLRKAPAMDAGKKASMQRGDPIEVLEDTGIWMDGYKWFKITSKRGIGYHWGGIFCISGDTLPEGVFDNCQFMKEGN